MTTESLPGSVTMPRERSQRPGFPRALRGADDRSEEARAPMRSRLERPDLPHPLERGPDVAGADHAAGGVADAGAQHEPVGAPAVLWPGQRDRQVGDDLRAVAPGGVLHGGEAVAGHRDERDRAVL